MAACASTPPLFNTQYADIYLANTAAYVAGETEFSQAPSETHNLGVPHNATLQNGGSITTRFDYSHVGEYWQSPDPTLRLALNPSIPPGFSDETGDFGTFNIRLAYAPADEMTSTRSRSFGVRHEQRRAQLCPGST